MKKAISPQAAAERIPDGARIMIGGFMGVGTPRRMIDALVSAGKRDLTLIANDTAMPGKGLGKLITARAVKRLIVSHIGLNPETQKQMNDGSLEVEFPEIRRTSQAVQRDFPKAIAERGHNVPNRNRLFAAPTSGVRNAEVVAIRCGTTFVGLFNEESADKSR